MVNIYEAIEIDEVLAMSIAVRLQDKFRQYKMIDIISSESRGMTQNEKIAMLKGFLIGKTVKFNEDEPDE